MAHEIQSNDRVVLHKEPAWHGLGILVEDAPTPREAAKMVFPWTVIQKHMIYRGIDERQQIVEDHLLNMRSDDGSQLGVVSDGYKVVQPNDMADFAEALLDQGQVKIETAGSIRGGKRIWFLLKGEPFNVALGDQIFPYVLLSNGYDGMTTFRVTPTTVRAVCSNTLHMSIPNQDTGELGTSTISIRHTVNVMDRIREAKVALAGYGKALEKTKELINVLTGKEVTKEEVQKFFLECYTQDFGDIPENPKDGFELHRREKAMSAFNSFSRRFDDEKSVSGTTAWCMANAYSGLIQHSLKSRGQNDVNRIERRIESNLFGLNQDRTQAAIQRAFQMALVG